MPTDKPLRKPADFPEPRRLLSDLEHTMAYWAEKPSEQRTLAKSHRASGNESVLSESVRVWCMVIPTQRISRQQGAREQQTHQHPVQGSVTGLNWRVPSGLTLFPTGRAQFQLTALASARKNTAKTVSYVKEGLLGSLPRSTHHTSASEQFRGAFSLSKGDQR